MSLVARDSRSVCVTPFQSVAQRVFATRVRLEAEAGIVK